MIEASQGADDVSDVGADAEIGDAADIDCDLHGDD
jgi:hypothetical protein